MKKLLAICLVMVLALSMSVSAFAVREDFVESPPVMVAPEVEGFDPADDRCSSTLIVVPFGDKTELSEEKEKELNEAYNDILDADRVQDLCDDLDDGDKLKVSDLFYLDTEGCDDHDGHKDFEVVLKDDELKNFEGLMYRDNDGNWVLVENVKIDGNKLIFTLKDFDGNAPFAIVVNTESSSTTGDIDHTYIYLTIMAVSALALVVFVVAAKKRKAA